MLCAALFWAVNVVRGNVRRRICPREPFRYQHAPHHTLLISSLTSSVRTILNFQESSTARVSTTQPLNICSFDLIHFRLSWMVQNPRPKSRPPNLSMNLLWY